LSFRSKKMNSLAGTLHTSYLLPDGMAHIPAAGRCTADGQRAADCLQWCSDRPATPEAVKRYRSALAHEPGQITRHHGAAADPLPAGPFGSKSKASGESAAQCMQVEPTTEIAKWKLERSEQVYARWDGPSSGARPKLLRPAPGAATGSSARGSPPSAAPVRPAAATRWSRWASPWPAATASPTTWAARAPLA
jgi:hypothetical protein